MVPVIFGLGVAPADRDGDGDGDGVRTELAEVCGALGVPSDGTSSGEELEELSPPAGPEQPATTPSAAPAEPSSSVRRETTLNCGALSKAAHRIGVKIKISCAVWRGNARMSSGVRRLCGELHWPRS
jgi:hypothetical protein